MPTTVVTDTQIYTLQPGQPLVLDQIVIGVSQAGGTSLIWMGQIIDIPPTGLPIQLAATSAQAKNHTLHCVTTVKDVNPASNRTSVEFRFSGATCQQQSRWETTVPSQGAYAQYVIDFVFV